MNILQVRTNVARLPKSVVSRMRQELAPFGRIFKKRDRIRERSHAQEKIVTVRRFEIVTFVFFMQHIVLPLREYVEETEILTEKKSAVVIDIVTHEPIRNRRLR
jgi:hypothetical protein